MTHHLRSEQTTGAVRYPRWYDVSRAGRKLRTASSMALLVGLFVAAVLSALVGAHLVLIGAVVGAWITLAAIVGLRYVLDAGCAFTLLVVGTIVAIDLASDSIAALLA